MKNIALFMLSFLIVVAIAVAFYGPTLKKEYDAVAYQRKCLLPEGCPWLQK